MNPPVPMTDEERHTRPAAEFGYSPDSGMAYRRCGDGRWYVLDLTGAEGVTAEEAGVVPLTVTT